MKGSILYLLLGSILLYVGWGAPLFAQQTADLDQAKVYLDEAKKLYEASSYEESIRLIRKAIPIYKAQGDLKDKIRCEALLCYNYIRKGEPKEALLIAQELNQDIANKQGKHHREKCELTDILGEASLSLGKNNEAQSYFDMSLRIYQSESLDEPLLLARIYNHLGLLYWNNGSWDQALEHQFKSYNLRKAELGGQHPEIAASLNDIGLIYSSKGAFAQARKYYGETLDIYEKIYPARHPKIANGLVNLAIIQRQDSSYSDALDNLEKSLEIWQGIYNEDHPKIAFLYSNIGMVYQAQGQNTVGLEYQKRALDIYIKNYGLRHPEIANTYNLIGLTLQNQQKWSEAREAFHKALLANYSEENDTGMYALFALQNYYNADILRSSLHMKALASEGLHLSRTLKAKDLKLALQFIEQCDTLIREIRQTRSNKGDKLSLGAGARQIYEDGVRICFRLAENSLNPSYYHRKAFYFSEQSKSTVLLGAINDVDAKQFAKIPNRYLEEEKEIQEKIAFAERKLQEKPGQVIEKQLRDELFALNRRYEKFIQGLEQEFPDYYNLKFNVNTSRIADLQASLDYDEMLISYFIAPSEKKLYIFSISQKKFKVDEKALMDEFDKNITALRNGIRFKAPRIFYRSAYYLHKQLIPKQISSRIQKLIFIPDGRLGIIPFEVLLGKDHQKEPVEGWQASYLLKDYAVFYNYSATLFLQSRAKKVSPKEPNILLYAPVDFKASRLQSLPASESEVKSISEVFARNSYASALYTRAKAQEAYLKGDELKNYSLIHLATHGSVDEERPELSCIYLSSNATQSEDGKLYNGEIYNLELDADLVTLSACETGLGKISQGEGIIGLSRALLYAGAKNILVSLWSVADASTSELMVQFYKENQKPKNEESWAEALRQAKLKLLQNNRYDLPYYWGAFILIGR